MQHQEAQHNERSPPVPPSTVADQLDPVAFQDHSTYDAQYVEPKRDAGNEGLLDIELEARIQFGAREMMLSELLELGSGDVLELDRLITEPVDLLVGDRIVARGEVVIVGGNFGLHITEVVAPQPRLESVRCLP
jgi:flagellar motor switch protein FliN/FliY